MTPGTDIIFYLPAAHQNQLDTPYVAQKLNVLVPRGTYKNSTYPSSWGDVSPTANGGPGKKI